MSQDTDSTTGTDTRAAAGTAPDGSPDAGGHTTPAPTGRALTLLAWLPVVGYAVMVPYAAALAVVLGPDAHPLLLYGVPELLLGVAYVWTLRDDRRTLAGTAGWQPNAIVWSVLGFVLGGTVLLAPLVPVAYFRRRRAAVGSPARGWLATVRRRDAEGTNDV